MSEAHQPEPSGRLRDEEASGRRVAALYENHSRAVLGICRMMLRDTHDAEDALQTTFLSAHRALLRGGNPRDESAWLFAIARNECRGRIRERMRIPLSVPEAALVELGGATAAPDEPVEDPSVRRALAALPERQREAVVLRDVFGLRSAEVGRALGLSVPAVEALLFRARRQLRIRLRPVSTALVVPVGIRDLLAQSVPGFTETGAPSMIGAAAGTGLLAKLASAPLAAKLAAGAATAVVGGSAVTLAETEEGNRRSSRSQAVGERSVGSFSKPITPAPVRASSAESSGASLPPAGDRAGHSDNASSPSADADQEIVVHADQTRGSGEEGESPRATRAGGEGKQAATGSPTSQARADDNRSSADPEAEQGSGQSAPHRGQESPDGDERGQDAGKTTGEDDARKPASEASSSGSGSGDGRDDASGESSPDQGSSTSGKSSESSEADRPSESGGESSTSGSSGGSGSEGKHDDD